MYLIVTGVLLAALFFVAAVSKLLGGLTREEQSKASAHEREVRSPLSHGASHDPLVGKT